MGANNCYNAQHCLYFFVDYFCHNFLVVQVVAKHENANSREYLDSLVESMHRILKMLDPAPSVQLQVRAPHTDSYVFQINKSSERYFSYAKYRSHEVHRYRYWKIFD